jgi:outer membrane lipoprotein-sorting protein
MRRAVTVVLFVGVVAGLVLWQLPGRKNDSALAAVADAMASVRSAHFVGWNLDQKTGERHQVEVWIKGASKLRMIQEGTWTPDIADNGEMTVTLREEFGLLMAWIEPSGVVRGFTNGPRRSWFVENDVPYLQMFVGREGMTSMLEMSGYMVESESTDTLPDGTPATVIVLRDVEGGAAVLTADANTKLLRQWKAYDSLGTPVTDVDNIEYGVEIPDSTFETSIPGGMPVIDGITPASSHTAAAHEAAEAKLKAAGWEWETDILGLSDVARHPGLHFQALDNDGGVVLYSRSRNAYHVVGRALVFTQGGAFQRIVEDADVSAPGRPHFTSLATPRLNPRVQAAEEELRQAGGKVVLKAQEGLHSCGSRYHSKLRFQVLRDDGVVIVYMPDTNTYRVFGKVRVFGMGLDQVVENGEIEAPGPPDGDDEQ